MKRQRSILQLIQHVGDGMPLQSVLEVAVETIRGGLNVDQVRILELDRTQESLELRAATGSLSDLQGDDSLELSTPCQESLTLMSKGTVTVEKPDAEPRLLGSHAHGDLGIVPGISTVIEGRSGPFGVIAVRGTDRNRDFPEEDRTFFETVAGALSVAVQLHDLGTRLERQDRLISVIAEQDSSHGETKLDNVLCRKRRGRINPLLDHDRGGSPEDRSAPAMRIGGRVHRTTRSHGGCSPDRAGDSPRAAHTGGRARPESVATFPLFTRGRR